MPLIELAEKPDFHTKHPECPAASKTGRTEGADTRIEPAEMKKRRTLSLPKNPTSTQSIPSGLPLRDSRAKLHFG
ncbi:MAG: hypothetical protein DWQ05_07880 [Calditrichaeota bacterium]|nr:MAG: hypothetical protein DWQ05_07880 [Calditrichota bacterium]